jgi:hypothetical protein
VKRLALAILLTGCGGGWPDLDPVDGEEHELDPRLGTELARSIHGFRIANVFLQDGLEIVYEESGAGWHAIVVDPDTLDVTALPTPPLEAGETLNLGRAMAPLRGVIAVARGPRLVISVCDGDRWTELPDPPVDASAAGAQGSLLAHDGNVYLVIGTTVLVWNGDAWTQPISSGSPVMLGGFDATTQWVIGADGARPIRADGTAGVLVAQALGDVTPAAVNGDADGFQLVASGMLWTFDGTTFTSGDAVSASPFSAPGSSRVLLATDGTPGSSWTFAENGTVGELALAPFGQQDIDYIELRPAPDTSTIGMVAADGLDGYAVLAARFLPLPFTGDPLTP